MKFTFIRGLRRLEGVQEFFLVINRPATIPGVCVEVALETAHFWATRAYMPRLIPLSDLYDPNNLNRTAYALGLDPYQHSPFFASLVDTWNNQPTWLRRLVGPARDDAMVRGYLQVQKRGPGIVEVTYQGNEQVLSSNDWATLEEVYTRLPEIASQDIALIFEEYELTSGSFFVTGRRLHSCMTSQRPEGSGPAAVDFGTLRSWPHLAIR